MHKYTFTVETGALARVIITVAAASREAARPAAYAALLAKSGRHKPAVSA